MAVLCRRASGRGSTKGNAVGGRGELAARIRNFCALTIDVLGVR